MNAITKTDGQVFQQGFSKIAPQVRSALPSHVPFERFERVVMLAVQRDPKLLAADQRSLFLACQKAATDGLMPDGREGALVRFWDNRAKKEMVQWIPMVAGIRKLAYNSGEVSSLTSEVVYDCDKFLVVKGDEPKIIHEPCLDPPDDAKMVAAYMIAKLKSGEVVREVMTRKQVLKIKNFTRSRDKQGNIVGPWSEWEDEQWRKTVIRRGSKQLPLSADRDADLRMQRAIERVDEDVVLEGRAIDPSALDEATTATQALEAPSKLDALEGVAIEGDLEGEVVENAPENQSLDDGWPGPDVPRGKRAA